MDEKKMKKYVAGKEVLHFITEIKGSENKSKTEKIMEKYKKLNDERCIAEGEAFDCCASCSSSCASESELEGLDS